MDLGRPEQSLLSFRFPLSWHTFQRMLTTGESILVLDTAADLGWQDNQEWEWVRSFIGVPLVISDETIGFLNAGHSEPNFFNPKHLLMLESLAHHASVAIQNARLLDESKRPWKRNKACEINWFMRISWLPLGKW